MRNYRHTKKSLQGFTLIEIVVSIAILATIGVTLVQVFFTTTRVNRKTELLHDIKQNGQFAMDTMTRMIRNSPEVVSVCETTGTSSRSIELANESGGSTLLGCVFDSNVSRIASVSASGTYYLTNKNLILGGDSCEHQDMSLSFLCTSFPDQPSRVHVSFTLYQQGFVTQSYERAHQLFESTINLRN